MAAVIVELVAFAVAAEVVAVEFASVVVDHAVVAFVEAVAFAEMGSFPVHSRY